MFPWPVFLVISSFGIPDTSLIINEVMFTPASQKEMKNKSSLRFRWRIKILIKVETIQPALQSRNCALKGRLRRLLRNKVATLLQNLSFIYVDAPQYIISYHQARSINAEG